MSTEAQITAWLASQKDAMLAELAEMVNTDGGSYDKAGVDRTGAQVRRFLEGHGIRTETVPGSSHGDCIRAFVEGAHAIGTGNQRSNIVLMGHRDTVFPKGEPERRPFTIEGNRAYGPGVADMKAGIVMNMFVLAAFAKFGGAPAPLVGLFTGDEEIGSPEGRPVIEDEARAARVVFNSRARPPDRQRRHRPQGRRLHGGRHRGQGRAFGRQFRGRHQRHRRGSPHKIVAIHALTDLARGITLNVGLVSGGQSVNTVAPLQARSTCAMSSPTSATRSWARSRRSSRAKLRARHGPR
jgi:glutamate carboxypeptidase